MDKVRFVFGKEMTDDQIVDAVVKMAKEHGILFKDNRKKKTKTKKAKRG